jgi:hypothetical protein
MDLQARQEELQTLASDRGVDWQGRLGGLPDDKRLRIAALATLLNIDPMQALRDEGSIKKLASEARERQRTIETHDKKERKFLHGLGIDVNDGG